MRYNLNITPTGNRMPHFKGHSLTRVHFIEYNGDAIWNAIQEEFEEDAEFTLNQCVQRLPYNIKGLGGVTAEQRRENIQLVLRNVLKDPDENYPLRCMGRGKYVWDHREI